jgi:hypothetical protein
MLLLRKPALEQALFTPKTPQFCFHFKRIVGVTPGQFRTSARILKKSDAEFC